jgi:1-deoxy-D-xylulose-5-phosphate synthase
MAIRYPRGRVQEFRGSGVEEFRKVEIGTGVCLRESKEAKVAVLSLGAIGHTVIEAIDWVKDLRGLEAQESFAHYDMRWLKPLDEALLHEVGKRYTKIVTVEDGVINGGLGSAVMEWMNDHGYTTHVTRLGVNDQFVEHGSTQELYQLLKLDKEGICESLLQALEQ